MVPNWIKAPWRAAFAAALLVSGAQADVRAGPAHEPGALLCSAAFRGSTETIWREAILTGKRLASESRYGEAEACFAAAVTAAETFGPADVRLYEAVSQLAGVLARLARYRESESQYRRAAEGFESAGQHRLLGITLYSLAEILRLQGQVVEARRSATRGFEILEQQNEPVLASIARINLALIELDQHRPSQAEALLEKSIAVLLQHPHTDEHVASALNTLAVSCIETGRLRQARGLLEQSIMIRENLNGPGHRSLLVPLNNAGAVYRDLNELEPAEHALRRSLAIAERALGPLHPHLAAASTNLAMVLKRQKRSAEAERLLERSVRIYEELGLATREYAAALAARAEVLAETGSRKEAAECRRRARTVLEESEVPGHPVVSVEELTRK